MAYIDMVALPFTGMFSAVLLAAAGRWVLRRSSLAGSLTSLRFARKPLGIAVALAVLPWLCLPVSFAMAAVPTLVRSHPWPWPMRKTPLVADLEREIGLTPGALFRGRVANLAGARGIYPASHPPFNNQHAYDHGFISAVGNDHRSLGFWSYSIPTLNTSSQFTTPFFHLVVTRFLNEPHSLSVRAHETATRFEPRDRVWGSNQGLLFVLLSGRHSMIFTRSPTQTSAPIRRPSPTSSRAPRMPSPS